VVTNEVPNGLSNTVPHSFAVESADTLPNKLADHWLWYIQ